MSRTAATILFLASLAACLAPQPCFVPASEIGTDTRILGVRVDPPESTADLTGADPLLPSAVSMLVVTSLETPLPTTISICLPPSVSEVDAEPGCPVGSPVIAELPSVPDLNHPFIYTPPLSLLQQQVDIDPVHGLAGVQLLLQISVAGDSGPVLAIKSLDYQLKGSLASVNHGLEVVGMEASNNGVHTDYPPPASIPLVVGQPNGLRPLIEPGPGAATAAETYLAYDNSGHLVQLQEQITYTFFVRSGLIFGPFINGAAIYSNDPTNVADEPPPGTPDPPDGLVTVVPDDQGVYSNYIYVVARDGRGAVAWNTSLFVTIDPRPCSADGFGMKCPQILLGCE